MKRRKSRRIAELAGMPHVFEGSELVRGGGLEHCFDRARSLVFEFGCGRGDTTVLRAAANPERNFVGVDLRGARLHRGAEMARDQGLRNIAFLHSNVETLPDLMSESRAEEAWLLFPDPFPKRRYARRRLTSPCFLDIYRTILKPGAPIHLKTDDSGLVRYTLKTLSEQEARIHERCDDLPAEESSTDPLMIQSVYERRFRADGCHIHYICFSLA
jgi:tRNA (guanine-N7-)-methyltransferase